jgi:hypothetical protein
MCSTWSPTAHYGADGSALRPSSPEPSRVRAAAVHARLALPGPLGELAARELTAYADRGNRGDPLVPQLARQVLALPVLPML